MVKTSEKEKNRQIVRRVLTAMGHDEPTYGDFRLWDPILDWRATAKLMDQARTRTALCHIFAGGRIVQDNGKPVVVARDIKASTEAEAAEILSRSSHVLVKWWLPDAPSSQVPAIISVKHITIQRKAPRTTTTAGITAKVAVSINAALSLPSATSLAATGSGRERPDGRQRKGDCFRADER